MFLDADGCDITLPFQFDWVAAAPLGGRSGRVQARRAGDLKA